MKLQCTDRKTFELTNGTETLGSLVYDGLFSFRAHLTIGNDQYNIGAPGIFSSKMIVSKNGVEIAAMSMNWKGQIIICFSDERKFILKSAGTFLNKYVVEDSEGKRLMLLDPDFNWSKFNYNYTVTYETAPDTLLILLAGYAANYFIAAMSGSM